ncbi:unnamed protein product [Rhizoctonia solani]|uniref:Checkpoint serine/threonine-protein kinase n=1 Tax=Rhizoctonia solani TaxID=456999 RepID=A0A8H3A2F8_9AGAM|nr:unnamed protein product [Rhizoctonia solani]
MSAEPPTVDISVIEHQKENIIPRKHGRSAVALSNLLSAPRPQLAKQLADGHAKHQEAVQIALEEDEDPMAAYVAYVDWVVECYPAGSNSESGLVPLLERATREFREDPRYINDLRYLKLWICYAGIVEKPETIYAYLLANDIGSVWELFYTEYANTLERGRNMRKADEIYQLGIARKAKPLKRIQQRYEEFQKRMLAAPAGSSADVDEVMAPAPPVPTARKVLGERTKATSSADSDPFVVSSSSSRTNNNGARIPVFRDADQPESGVQTNEWADVGTRDSRRKENHSDGKSWQGETLPQLKHGVFTPKTPKIEVYRDTEDPAGSRTPHAPRPGHEDVFAPSHQPKESEALRQNPFKNWDSATSKQPAAGASKLLGSSPSTAPAASSSSAPPPSSSSSDPLPAWPKPKPLKPLPSLPKRLRNPAPGPGKKAEQICLPLARLQASGSGSGSGSGSEEYSPDEARARALGLLGKKWAPPPVVVAVPVRDDTARARTNDTLGKGGKKDKERTMTMTMAGEPTVTVNTRAALGDVFEMFNTSPGREKVRQDTIEEEDEGEEAVSEASITTPAIDDATFWRSENFNRPPIPYFEVGKSEGETASAASNENARMLSENRPKPRENKANENAPTESVFRVFNENGPGPSARAPSAKMSIFVDEPAAATKAKIPIFRDETGPGVTAAGPKNVLKTKSFTPFVDSSVEEPPAAPAVTPSGPLKPKTFAPFVDSPAEPKTPKSFAVFQDEEEVAQPGSSGSKFTLNPPPQLPDHEEYDEPADDEDDEDETRYVPMGGRLGHFNVMTPITERTCEFTTTMRAAGSWRDEIAEDPAGEVEEEMKVAVLEPINPFSPELLQYLIAQVPVPSSVQDLSHTQADQVEALIKFGKSKKGDELPITLGQADEYSVVAKHLLSSVIRPRRLYHYQDESFLIMDYCGQGSLLDTVNRSASCGFSPANTTQPGLDELLVMFFTTELLRLISAMHAAGFVHGDLKIDNCLLRTEDVPDEARAWSSKYDPTGEHGWSYKGIRMIDFGRGIDTNLFQPGQTFIGDWPTDQRDAVELREGRAWTFQTDYFGLAGIVYCMLFGKYIETVTYQDGQRTKYKINMPLKRYWQTEIWSSLFDMLLNPTTVRPDGDMPLTAELDELRGKMEKWLVENCDKGSRSLKSLLKKVSIAATEGKPI